MATPDIVSEQTIDHDTRSGVASEQGEQSGAPSTRPTAGTAVWAVVLLASAAYFAFGSITTRSWRLNAFQQAWVQDISPRRVAHVWSYQLTHLPQMSSEWLLKVGFVASLFILVVGAFTGLWLILHGTWDTAANPEEHDTTPGPEVA